MAVSGSHMHKKKFKVRTGIMSHFTKKIVIA